MCIHLGGVYFACKHGNHRNSKEDTARVTISSSFKSRTFNIFTLAVSCLGKTHVNMYFSYRLQNIKTYVGSFTSQDFEFLLHSFCADSSSPQISAIPFGHLQGKVAVFTNLRDSPQNFRTNCAGKCQTPGSRNSLVCLTEIQVLGS